MTTTAPRSMARLYWLALGTFAIGTEGFMIAPLLPDLSRDLSVSLVSAGQLVTVFALTYALSSPVLTALTGDIDRRRLLIASMLAFAAANFVAWSAEGYSTLLVARILLAIAAGLYVPNATALASALVEPSRRGTALSIVTGGVSVAVALGVPLGALVGDRFGWRLNFAAVGVMALIATAGLLSGLPRDIADHLPVASLRERLDVVRQPAIFLALLTTMLWATGAYAVYTYLASFLALAAAVTGSSVSAVLFMWGVAAVIGLRLGGRLNDRFGHLPVIVTSLSLLALAFLSLSTSAILLPPTAARTPILMGIALWGVSAWSFFPAQQARLISIAGAKVAPVVLSLNASFQFLGFSAGAALGSLTLANASPLALGFVGASCVAAALSLVMAMSRRAPSPSPVMS
ncbi:Predicted arabinose efflux permease, MFS family [Rhizobiales bacterium GAS188]|nr:Predicted arabinose efflux permease, MFS family [Rhizobiales bacterium GAS188]